jgi:ribulose-5-phosphate 4-epimerase/fuculose-1-phosphate aldolase
MSNGIKTSEVDKLSEFSPEERELRVQLAAAYRLSAHYGWDDIIYSHISVRLPGEKHEFLINPFGLRYTEVTASSLVKIDTHGNVVHPGFSKGRVNKAGFVIHSAIHEKRHDAICLLHNHIDEIVAVSNLKCGLLPISQTMLYLGPISYHDYEGVVTSDEEKVSLVRDLGKESQVLLLRNHGALTVGRTIGEAFTNMWYLAKACKIQLNSMAAAGGNIENLHFPSKEIQKLTYQQNATFNTEARGSLEYESFMRYLDIIDPSYRS